MKSRELAKAIGLRFTGYNPVIHLITKSLVQIIEQGFLLKI
jgi:hypothetical protein